MFRKCILKTEPARIAFDQEEKFLPYKPYKAFNYDYSYRLHALNAISEIRDHLKNGDLASPVFLDLTVCNKLFFVIIFSQL